MLVPARKAKRKEERQYAMLKAPICSQMGAASMRQVVENMAGTTGLEPAASAVTGQRSNQLNYVPTRESNEMSNRQSLCGFASIA
jgi:hypothetical protein